MPLWLLILLILALPVAQSQDMVATSGSLVMVRSDDGDDGFLNAPSNMVLSKLQQSFNAQVDTVIFVHGFNTSYDGASETFTKNVQLLTPELGNRNYVGFYWPSDLLIDFAQGVANANKAGKYLVYLAAQITRWYGSSNHRIHVLGHSLGARVILSCFKESDARYVKWGHCFLLAAAVHANVYYNSFSGTNLIPNYSWAYFSHNDGVLKYLYALYYWLFDRNFQQFRDSRELQQWQQMSVQQKIEYMRQIDVSAQQGRLPSTAFEQQIYDGIQRSSEEAMGLIGAQISDPSPITRVGNVDMSNVADGHTYWGNATVMRTIANVIK